MENPSVAHKGKAGFMEEESGAEVLLLLIGVAHLIGHAENMPCYILSLARWTCSAAMLRRKNVPQEFESASGCHSQ